MKTREEIEVKTENEVRIQYPRTVERIEEKARQQALLDLLAHFSEYNVPITMSADDVQKEIVKFMEEE